MKKKIPLKNYFILILVILLTILAVFYMRDWYNTSKEFYAQNSVMTKVVREIKNDEISNYILENQKFILYVSSGRNTNIKSFEDEFKNLIQKMDLGENVLYMNLDEVDVSDFYNSLNSYASSTKVKNQIVSSDASMYVFTDGKLTMLLNNVNNYSMKRLESIIDRWEIK